MTERYLDGDFEIDASSAATSSAVERPHFNAPINMDFESDNNMPSNERIAFLCACGKIAYGKYFEDAVTCNCGRTVTIDGSFEADDPRAARAEEYAAEAFRVKKELMQQSLNEDKDDLFFKCSCGNNVGAESLEDMVQCSCGRIVTHDGDFDPAEDARSWELGKDDGVEYDKLPCSLGETVKEVAALKAFWARIKNLFKDLFKKKDAPALKEPEDDLPF
jgi:hypothetical protein